MSTLEPSSAIGLIVLCSALLTLSLTPILMEYLPMRKLLALLAVASLSLLVSSALVWASAPERANQYKAYLRQHAIVVWGVEAPIPLFAGQIHQESAWNPEARSKYACGLTQFTPDTAEWIAQQYRVDVGRGECTDARWAIRAMLRYDKHLSDAIKNTNGECSNRRFMLSAYNGGLGWVVRDRIKAVALGFDATDYDQVAPFNAGRGAAFFAENRTYPEKIIKHQLHYTSWGGPITCKEKIENVRRSESVGARKPAVDPWRCAGIDRIVCRMAPLHNRP